jgi:hypothetical protein
LVKHIAGRPLAEALHPASDAKMQSILSPISTP